MAPWLTVVGIGEEGFKGLGKTLATRCWALPRCLAANVSWIYCRRVLVQNAFSGPVLSR